MSNPITPVIFAVRNDRATMHVYQDAPSAVRDQSRRGAPETWTFFDSIGQRLVPVPTDGSTAMALWNSGEAADAGRVHAALTEVIDYLTPFLDSRLVSPTYTLRERNAVLEQALPDLAGMALDKCFEALKTPYGGISAMGESLSIWALTQDEIQNDNSGSWLHNALCHFAF